MSAKFSTLMVTKLVCRRRTNINKNIASCINGAFPLRFAYSAISKPKQVDDITLPNGFSRLAPLELLEYSL